MTAVTRYVLAREHNVLRIDFRRRPDPPAPKFPGAAALRTASVERTCADAARRLEAQAA